MRRLETVLNRFVPVALVLLFVMGSSCSNNSRYAEWVDECREIRLDVGRWTNNVRVIAFLTDDVTLEELDSLERDIEGWDRVDGAEYFSKADAVEEFKLLFVDQPDLIAQVEEDPGILPASLRIRTTLGTDHSIIVDRLVVRRGIREVSAADPAVDDLEARAASLGCP